MASEKPIIPVVERARYNEGGINLYNIYGDRHHDVLYLHHPENPPSNGEGGGHLNLSQEQAESLRDRLIELLG